MTKEFYNQYVDHQLKNAFNERHFRLLDKTSRWISSSSPVHVLELGCGIGIISFLFLRKFTKINLTAIDLSDVSIDIARRINLKHKDRSVFHCHDACNLHELLMPHQKFDIVLAFDIFEHIEAGVFTQLIHDIAEYMKDNALLIANIPNHLLLQKLKSEKIPNLQPIEEEISPEYLISLCKKENLFLQYFEEYSIWINSESHFYVFQKRLMHDFGVSTPLLSLKKRLLRSLYYRYVWHRVLNK